MKPLHTYRTALLIFLGVILSLSDTYAQSKMFATSNGQTSFYSSTPAEDISAVNKKTQFILNTSTGEMAVLMKMRDFDFPNELMEEHFNENYVESEKYPKATFKGKLDQNIDFSKNGTYDATATGVFTVHGRSKNRTISGKLTVQDDKILLDSAFEVPLVDHDIEVPKIVFVKIAQVIQVKSSYVLTPYKN
jgi:polyisoprenoid-binding protein YceI